MTLPSNESYLPHRLAVFALDMTMQIRPSKAGSIAIAVRAIVPQQDHRVLEYFILFVLDP